MRAQATFREYLEQLRVKNAATEWADVESWPLELIRDGPQQPDGSSCGAYTLMAIDVLVRRASTPRRTHFTLP